MSALDLLNPGRHLYHFTNTIIAFKISYMRMKKLPLSCLALILSTGCTHKVFRRDYHFDPAHPANETIVLTKRLPSPDSLTKVGNISLKDGLWVVDCNELQALKVLKAEAHQLRADVIHIVKEKRPDVQSSCYRCEADFYRYKYAGMKLKSDEAYSGDRIIERLQKDRKRNAVILTCAAVLGFGIGVILGFTFF